MNLTTISFSALTDVERHSFTSFLKAIAAENHEPASENMWSDSWETNTHTLPYILHNTNRFAGETGEFHVIFDDEFIIGCGGVYLSDFDSKFAFAGSRTWVNRDYRNKLVLRDNLLAVQKKWALEHGCAAVGVCFNNYNKNLINVFKRIRMGERSDRIIEREKHHLFFNGVIEVPFAVTVQHTKQWVLYERLDPQWSFNWESIRND